MKQIIEDTIKKEGEDCDLNFIDTSEIYDMSDLFCENKPTGNLLTFFNGDISKWDVSNVEDMTSMFEFSKFNGDISKWDVSKVENMDSMFAYSQFNGNISDWDVSNVEIMSHMFTGSKFNTDISKWKLPRIKIMKMMFVKCPLYKIYGETPTTLHGHLLNINNR